jgi:hypothetical protein
MTAEMRRWCVGGLAAVLVATVSMSVATAQSKDPAFGTWKLNVAKSKFSPGPAPKESTLTIEADGPGRKVAVVGVAGDGTPVKWGYSGNFDRKEVKVSGTNPDADVVSLRRIDANSTRTTYKKAGKQTLVNGIAVSADGKTMTVVQSGVNAKGEPVKNTLIFDRQ